jgi:hypothetical protein
MENYFNYFTEVEEHFQRRRGTTLLLSTLDWSLIETWKDAGIPLEAVLRGIDATFERSERRPARTRKVNSLAYCAQEVLSAAEDMKEAAVGTAAPAPAAAIDLGEVATFFQRNSTQIESASLPAAARPVASDAARTLRDLASGLKSQVKAPLEELERRLTVMEEKLFAALLATTGDEELLTLRAQADREMAPYRSKMPGSQIEQLQKQCVHKMLLDRYHLPRLSLFYM